MRRSRINYEEKYVIPLKVKVSIAQYERLIAFSRQTNVSLAALLRNGAMALVQATEDLARA